MGQLTLKQLDEKINSTWAAITSVEDRVVVLEEQMDSAISAEVDVAQTWSFDEDGESLQITMDADPASLLPPWGLEIVEALIEALKGVRLQGAQQFALALEAKYFPPEEVEEDEIVAV